MAVSLESLNLLPEELQLAQEAVRKLAYERWEAAGRPQMDGSHFWTDAERFWIERCYVPPRLPEQVAKRDQAWAPAAQRQSPEMANSI